MRVAFSVRQLSSVGLETIRVEFRSGFDIERTTWRYELPGSLPGAWNDFALVLSTDWTDLEAEESGWLRIEGVSSWSGTVGNTDLFNIDTEIKIDTPLQPPAVLGFDAVNFSSYLPGDFNCDSVVDAADYTVWRDNQGATSGLGLVADGNFDGVVNADDLDVWRQHYGETVDGASQATPEPTAAALATMLSLLYATRRMP